MLYASAWAEEVGLGLVKMMPTRICLLVSNPHLHLPTTPKGDKFQPLCSILKVESNIYIVLLRPANPSQPTTIHARFVCDSSSGGEETVTKGPSKVHPQDRWRIFVCICNRGNVAFICGRWQESLGRRVVHDKLIRSFLLISEHLPLHVLLADLEYELGVRSRDAVRCIWQPK